MFVDSHAHITSSQFDSDRQEVLERAKQAGVHLIINPGTDLEDSKRAVELAEKYENVYACVGFHPHDAKKADDKSLLEIEELCVHPKVVAIGEIGLDFHYDFSPRDVQAEVFKAQIGIAQRRNLPIVIHTRESNDETLKIVEDLFSGRPKLKNSTNDLPGAVGVFHCFSGDISMAEKIIAMGFYVSMPGVVTFKNPGFAAEVATHVSIRHLLLETDSPYLAPVPHRGKRNEPANLPLIAEKIAALCSLSVAELAQATSSNATKLFNLPAL